MTGLVLKLAPGERVLINGAVVENGDRRTRLTLVTPNAHVLRLRDAIHPHEVDTPVKRVCYVAQMAVAGEATPEDAGPQLDSGIAQLMAVFRDAESTATLQAARQQAAEQRFYPALRSLRTLLPLEAQLLDRARAAAPRVDAAE